MNFRKQEPYPYEMYVAFGQRQYESFHRTLGQSCYGVVPLDPRYLAWPETDILPEETVNAWHNTHLDAITDGILQEKQPDPLSDFFGAKKASLGNKVTGILSMIYEREEIAQEHSRKIDYESCAVKSKLFQVDDWVPGINRNVDKIRETTERELLGLEREKRMEQVACWRDVSRLRMELSETMQEWYREKQKDRLFSDSK